jgi:hypothetical protein
VSVASMPNDENLKSEAPFLHPLASMGWETEEGDPDVEYLSGNRESFDEMLLKGDLRAALRRINRTAGQEWLDDVRINQAIHKLESVASPSLMEANRGHPPAAKGHRGRRPPRAPRRARPDDSLH